MCLRFDLAVARAAVLPLDGIDKDTVEENDLFKTIKTEEELEQLRTVAKKALKRIEAELGFHNIPLPDPEWEKPAWVLISSQEETEEHIQTLYQSQLPGPYPVAEGT